MSELEQSEKKLKAYAYLTATLNLDSSIQDVLDCITPFMLDVIRESPDKPINAEDMHADLKKFGLSIPFYAVQQLLPRLQNRGFVEWNNALRTFVPTSRTGRDKATFVNLADDFGDLEEKISRFALSISDKIDVELRHPILFDTWCDALISTLKQNFSQIDPKTIKINGAIVFNSGDIESFVINRFVSEAQHNDKDLFDRIVRVYSGILIEEFISNIQAIGAAKGIGNLTLFYDTTVILRLLGTSGELLKNATLDMHNTLQALGAKTYFISNTMTEVTRIIESLRIRYQKGLEIHGETSDAIHSGEISIAQIADLEGTAEARLAQLNIFPYQYNYASRSIEDKFQIDLNEFSNRLKSEAQKRERGYKLESANNDAEVLAIIIRLRAGKIASSLASAKYLFVSSNNLLQRTSRVFCIESIDSCDQSTIPPILTVGQMTTAAWLSHGHKFEPQKVSQELLANCYSAVQPDSEWADAFGQAMDEFRENNTTFMNELSDASLIFSGVRNIAKDETLNQSIALKKVNLAELIRQEASRIDREKSELFKEAAREGDKAGRTIQRQAQELRFEEISKNISSVIVFAAKWIIIIGFVFAYIMLNAVSQSSMTGFVRYSLIGLVGVFSIISVGDSLGIKFLAKVFDRFREKIADTIYRRLLRPILSE